MYWLVWITSGVGWYNEPATPNENARTRLRKRRPDRARLVIMRILYKDEWGEINGDEFACARRQVDYMKKSLYTEGQAKVRENL